MTAALRFVHEPVFRMEILGEIWGLICSDFTPYLSEWMEEDPGESLSTKCGTRHFLFVLSA